MSAVRFGLLWRVDLIDVDQALCTHVPQDVRDGLRRRTADIFTELSPQTCKHVFLMSQALSPQAMFAASEQVVGAQRQSRQACTGLCPRAT